jgi:hypothetical protein
MERQIAADGHDPRLPFGVAVDRRCQPGFARVCVEPSRAADNRNDDGQDDPAGNPRRAFQPHHL